MGGSRSATSLDSAEENGSPNRNSSARKLGSRSEAARVSAALVGRRLAVQAEALRKLVRIKLADDNDLAAAQCALSTCNEFFSHLSALAVQETGEGARARRHGRGGGVGAAAGRQLGEARRRRKNGRAA